MADQRLWREEALDVYRLGWIAVEAFRADPRDVLQFYLEDLKDALLDLKQATAAGNETSAADYIEEVRVIVAQLNKLAGG